MEQIDHRESTSLDRLSSSRQLRVDSDGFKLPNKVILLININQCNKKVVQIFLIMTKK